MQRGSVLFIQTAREGTQHCKSTFLHYIVGVSGPFFASGNNENTKYITRVMLRQTRHINDRNLFEVASAAHAMFSRQDGSTEYETAWGEINYDTYYNCL